MDETRQRLEEDMMGEFTRYEMDRDITGPGMEFHNENNELFIEIALKKLRENGKISLLDAGCGSGKALYDLQTQLAFREPSIEPNKVVAVGVNNKDYSNESDSGKVRKAIKEGKIKYVVSTLQDLALQTKFDLAWSYETLIHNDDITASKALANLIGILDKDGVLFVNLTEGQRSSKAVTSLLNLVKKTGRISTYEYKLSRDNQTRVFIKFQRN